MVSWTDRRWLVADDETVIARLRAELERVRDADPAAVLGVTDPAEARAAFLEATKTFHPSRFARRDGDVRRLANEVFLVIKDAYDRLSAQVVGGADDAAVEPAPERPRPKREPTAAEDATRRQARERRRDALRQRLVTEGVAPAPPPRQTARIAAVADPTEPRIDGDPEARFQLGLAQLQGGKLGEAAATFKALAVAVPSEKRYRLYMHYAWGRQAEAGGSDDEARAEYKRALGLDASFAPALEAMSSLRSAGKKKEGGLFSKWFRKG